MIVSFKHRGLKRLYERDDAAGVRPNMLPRVRDILARLDVADEAEDMDMPGYALHPLKHDMKGYWAVKVNANWRIVFRFEEGDVLDVELMDYH